MGEMVFHIVVSVIGIVTSALLMYALCSVKISTELTMWNMISSVIAGFWISDKIYDCGHWIYENIINKTK